MPLLRVGTQRILSVEEAPSEDHSAPMEMRRREPKVEARGRGADVE